MPDTLLAVGNIDANTISAYAGLHGFYASLATAAAGAKPYHPALSPDGRKLLVPNYDAGTVTPYYLVLGTWVAGPAFAVGTNPVCAAWHPDSEHALIALMGEGKVVPLVLAARGTYTAGTKLTVHSAPYRVAISTDGSTAVVANSGEQYASFLRYSNGTWTVVANESCSLSYGAAVSPNGEYGFMSCPAGHGIIPWTLSGGSYDMGTLINLGMDPYQGSISPDGIHALVAAGTAVKPLKYDPVTRTWSAGANLSVPSGAFGVEIAPDGVRALVTPATTSTNATILTLSGDTWAVQQTLAVGAHANFGAIWSAATTTNTVDSIHVPVTPVANNPVMVVGTEGQWDAGQCNQPTIFDDPLDPTRLVIFYSASAVPGVVGIYIGRAWALKSDPTTWHKYEGNPILSDKSRYIDTILQPVPGHPEIFWLYTSNLTDNVIELYVSTDGGYTFTPDPANPLITPTGQGRIDGAEVTSLSVVYDGDLYHGYYNWRDSGTVLPGLRYASSSDGKTWTKGGGAGDLTGVTRLDNSPWSAYFESQQALYVDGKYLLFCSNYNSAYWTINAFSADSPTGPFTPAANNSAFSQVAAGYQTANWYVFNVGSDTYIAYQYCTTVGNYGLQHWSIGMALVDGSITDFK